MKTRGFTLIELLAVIIILGILTTLIAPKVVNMLDEAERNTNMTSAQNLAKTAKLKASNNEMIGNTQNIKINYTTGENINYLDYAGEKPENGQVQIKLNGEVAMAVKFGDYCYLKTYTSDDITEISYNESTCGENADVFVTTTLYRSINNQMTQIDKSEIQTGDTVILSAGEIEEHFIVLLGIEDTPRDNIALLAENNLNVGQYKDSSIREGFQGEEKDGYQVKFAEIGYWLDYEDVSNIYDETKNGSPGTDDYSIAYYINNYIENLNNLGFNINKGRILKETEAQTGGIAKDFITEQDAYWLCTYNRVFGVRVVNDGNSDSLCSSGTAGAAYGIRPLIYINIDSIE